MAYIKKNRLYAIKKTVLIAACIICAVISLSAVYIYYSTDFGKASDAGEDVSSISKIKTVVVARAKSSMGQGELLDADKAEMVEIPADIAPEGAITSLSQLNNMRLNRKVAENEILNNIDVMSSDAFYEDSDRLIEHNFSEGAVPAEVSAGSEIDIRLFIEGEEDSVVVSKAEVVSRINNLLSFYLNGIEQEYIKEAAAEGMLFAVKYIDNSQKASEVTYIPLYNKGRK